MFQAKEQTKSRWHLKPLVYITAFFYPPVSKEALRETLRKADRTMDRADQTSCEHEELSRRVAALLSEDEQSPRLGQPSRPSCN